MPSGKPASRSNSRSERASTARSASTSVWRRRARRQTILQLESLEDRLTPSTVLPNGFEETRLVTGLNVPTVMEFAPDGRLFVGEKSGQVRVIKNGDLLSTPLLTAPATSENTRGLLGLALDPHFSDNGYVYVYYTRLQLPAADRVSRFTVSPGQDVADPASEVVILDDIPSGDAGWHDGGGMDFGKDGLLYVSTGNAHNNDLPQSLASLAGKVLRIDPASYPNVVPASNPFVGTAGARPEIWALGFRNVYTSAVDPVTGLYYVNDVGEMEWEEINQIVGGANYGWPLHAGITSTPGFTDPVYVYAHEGADAAITGGTFYRATQFPEAFRGTYFFADYVRGFIRQLNPTTHQAEEFATNVSWPVDLDVGPDGSLYYLSIYTGSVFKIQYVDVSNRSPQAVATADQTSGLNPLQVTFDASGSSDPDGDTLSYRWDFGDQSPFASGMIAMHTYRQPGQYLAQLTVSDGRGASRQADPIQITVDNRAPTGTILTPAANLLYSAGDTITFSGSGTDAEDGVLPASAFTWNVLLKHSDHTHPMLGPLTGITTGSFKVPQEGELSEDVGLRILLTVTDSGGLKHESMRDLQPHKATLTLATDPAGLPVSLDGQVRATPASVLGVVGMFRTLSAPLTQFVGDKTYEFVSWSNGSTSAQQKILFPATNTVYTARYQLLDPNRPPQGVATADVTSGPAPLPVTFEASGSSDPDGDALSYFWDFGDLSPGQAGLTVTHTYTLPGQFQARLTVSDGKGSGQADPIQITVSPGAPPNRAPEVVAGADQTSGPAPLQVTLNGSGSSDPDGDPLSYLWDFGDLTPLAAGLTVTHTYTQPGQFQATLTVSDGKGGTKQADPISITILAPNGQPQATATADKTSGPAPLQVTFNGSGSSDPDGDPLSYLWDFGDLTPAGTGSTLTHTYAQPGQYQARLTVDDGRGGSAQAAVIQITASSAEPTNHDPQAVAAADATTGSTPLQVAFSASGSSDPDGNPLTYFWNFGDQSPAASGSTVTHTYTQAGQYAAQLTVQDGRGGSAQAPVIQITASTSEPPNHQPQAVATADVTSGSAPLQVNFSASGSSDPDGDTLTYLWNFGDQSPVQAGRTLAHTYTQPGQFQAILIVSDGQAGPQQTFPLQITVSAPTGGETNAPLDCTFPQAFVTGLYADLLRRAPDAEGLSFWEGQLASGASVQQVAASLWRTAEHRALQVEGYYTTFLGRSATQAERSAWVAAFQAGANETDVIQAFLNSTEYTLAHPDPASFVDGLYTQLLKRPADGEGRAFWIHSLQVGDSRAKVARAFLLTPERLLQTVEDDYAAFLHRAPDAQDLTYWSAVVKAGKLSTEDMGGTILASREYWVRSFMTCAGLSSWDFLVHAAYLDVLKRVPDAAGLSYWGGQLEARIAPEQVMTSLWQSVEHRALQVEGYYTTFLGRSSTEAERSVWVVVFQAGAGETDVIQAFLSSTEYTLAHPDPASFVDGLYTQLLKRAADAEGRAFWIHALQQGDSRAKVVHDFLRTREWSLQVIDAYYADFFHRPAEATERAYWLTQIQSGGAGQGAVVGRLLTSDEYFLRAAMDR